MLSGFGWRHHGRRRGEVGPAVFNWGANIGEIRYIGLQVSRHYADVHGKKPRGERKQRCDGAGRSAKRKQRSRVGALANFEMVTGVNRNVEYFTPSAVVPLAGIDWAKDVHGGAGGTGGGVDPTKPSDTGGATSDVAHGRGDE